ncbi:hypothetical protein BGZ63DRAFT_41018 [Mariannaea sp. PMI_226]|nr:hypothetical protein BGZ63DRAFT_41018 [Mariannaea sp. PMI_226]
MVLFLGPSSSAPVFFLLFIFFLACFSFFFLSEGYLSLLEAMGTPHDTSNVPDLTTEELGGCVIIFFTTILHDLYFPI